MFQLQIDLLSAMFPNPFVRYAYVAFCVVANVAFWACLVMFPVTTLIVMGVSGLVGWIFGMLVGWWVYSRQVALEEPDGVEYDHSVSFRPGAADELASLEETALHLRARLDASMNTFDMADVQACEDELAEVDDRIDTLVQEMADEASEYGMGYNPDEEALEARYS